MIAASLGLALALRAMTVDDLWALERVGAPSLSPDGTLAELIELRDHPYFLACQYHPEFQSKPNKPHPLFRGFIEACLAHSAIDTPRVAADPLSPPRVREEELVPQR